MPRGFILTVQPNAPRSFRLLLIYRYLSALCFGFRDWNGSILGVDPLVLGYTLSCYLPNLSDGFLPKSGP